MVLLIIRPSNPFGVDGDVEYAGPGEGNLKAMDRTIFETPPTNIDIVKARIMDVSYGAQSEYNVMVAWWVCAWMAFEHEPHFTTGTIILTLKYA